jgi:hypothetical protein
MTAPADWRPARFRSQRRVDGTFTPYARWTLALMQSGQAG